MNIHRNGGIVIHQGLSPHIRREFPWGNDSGCVVEADNGVSLDFAETTGAITPQHYAFLVGEEEFDAAFGRIRDQGLPYWADPGQSRPGVINHRDGGRGLYFEDPDGHLLEIITRPYGSGS